MRSRGEKNGKERDGKTRKVGLRGSRSSRAWTARCPGKKKLRRNAGGQVEEAGVERRRERTYRVLASISRSLPAVN